MKARRAIVLIFAMLMLLASLPLGASAANSGSCGKNLTWSLSNGVLTIQGTGEMDNYNISSSSTTPPWPTRDDTVKEIVVESGVTSIGDYAFYNCYGLTGVTLPEGLEYIGDHAFFACNNTSFTDVKLPSTLRTFGKNAFQGCNYLHMITIPSGVKTLPDYLFYSCQGLFDVAIPKTVNTIGEAAFRTTMLCDVHYDGTEAEWAKITVGTGNELLTGARRHLGASVAYVPYIEGKTCGRGLTYTLSEAGALTVTGSGWMYNYSTGSSYADVPWPTRRDKVTSAVLESGVKSVGDNAFYNCYGMTGVTLPEGLEYIGDHAFFACNNTSFTDVKLPSTLRTFGKNAFQGCNYLHMITIPSGVTALPDYLFYDCKGLFDIAIPRTVTSIGEAAFRTTKLCDVHYDGTEAEWADITVGTGNELLTGARKHCGASIAYVPYIEGVTCGRGLTYTLSEAGALTVTGSGWMFDYTTGSSYADVPWPTRNGNVTSVVLESGVKSVGDNAFYNCYGMTGVTLPEGLEYIGDHAFFACNNESFNNVKLPSTLRTFGKNAFQGCTYLHMITIPGGVTALPDYLFYDCKGLFDIAIPRTVTSIGEAAFRTTKLCDVHYDGTEANWANIIVGTGNELLTGARKHCGASIAYVPYIQGVTCGRGLTYTLSSEGALTVTGSGWMFDWTTGSSYSAVPWPTRNGKVTSVVLQSGVKSIGANAFYDCQGLTVITIPLSVGLIGDSAFYVCDKLADVWYGGTRTDRYERITVVGTHNDRLEHEDCIWHYTEEPVVLPFRIDALEVYGDNGTKLSSVPKGPCFVSVTITRVEEDSGNARVLLAAYGADGRMHRAMYVKVGVTVGASATFELPVDNSDGGVAAFRAFVVSALADFTPLGEAAVFPQ